MKKREPLIIIILLITMSVFAMTSLKHSLNDNVDKNIELIGFAKDTKAGAVIVTENNEIVYMEAIDYWNSELIDKK